VARIERNEGVRKMGTAPRETVADLPELESLSTSHIERVPTGGRGFGL
jgi:hypothetical protein